MSVYLVAQVEISDTEKYKEYTALSGPLIKKYKGKIIVRGGEVESLEGSSYSKRIVVVEFPNEEAVHEFYFSSEYQEAKLIRQTCSKAQFIIAKGIPQ